MKGVFKSIFSLIILFVFWVAFLIQGLNCLQVELIKVILS